MLGSALAALSSERRLLIAARVVQGAGGAVLVPLTLTLISDAFPVEKRGTAIGIWGGVTGLGVAAGPVVGGAIVQGISWQWIFWLNVPVGLVVAVLALLRLRESRGPRPQLDIVGLVLAGAGCSPLTWAPVRAPQYGWGSGRGDRRAGGRRGAAGRVPGLGTAGAVPDAAAGLLPASGRSATANAVVFFQFVSLIGSLFFITQLFQIGLGYSPLRPACASWCGWRCRCWSPPPAGALADRFGNRPFMLGGLVLQAAGLGWLAAVTDAGGQLPDSGRAAGRRPAWASRCASPRWLTP